MAINGNPRYDDLNSASASTEVGRLIQSISKLVSAIEGSKTSSRGGYPSGSYNVTGIKDWMKPTTPLKAGRDRSLKTWSIVTSKGQRRSSKYYSFRKYIVKGIRTWSIKRLAQIYEDLNLGKYDKSFTKTYLIEEIADEVIAFIRDGLDSKQIRAMNVAMSQVNRIKYNKAMRTLLGFTSLSIDTLPSGDIVVFNTKNHARENAIYRRELTAFKRLQRQIQLENNARNDTIRQETLRHKTKLFVGSKYRTINRLTEEYVRNDPDLLNNRSYLELLDLCDDRDLQVSPNATKEQLINLLYTHKASLYNQRTGIQKAANKNQAYVNKLRAKGLTDTKINRRMDRKRKFSGRNSRAAIEASLKGITEASKFGTTTSANVPIINFSDNGIDVDSITKAVPVFVVNYLQNAKFRTKLDEYSSSELKSRYNSSHTRGVRDITGYSGFKLRSNENRILDENWLAANSSDPSLQALLQQYREIDAITNQADLLRYATMFGVQPANAESVEASMALTKRAIKLALAQEWKATNKGFKATLNKVRRSFKGLFSIFPRVSRRHREAADSQNITTPTIAESPDYLESPTIPTIKILNGSINVSKILKAVPVWVVGGQTNFGLTKINGRIKTKVNLPEMAEMRVSDFLDNPNYAKFLREDFIRQNRQKVPGYLKYLTAVDPEHSGYWMGESPKSTTQIRHRTHNNYSSYGRYDLSARGSGIPGLIRQYDLGDISLAHQANNMVITQELDGRGFEHLNSTYDVFTKTARDLTRQSRSNARAKNLEILKTSLEKLKQAKAITNTAVDHYIKQFNAASGDGGTVINTVNKLIERYNNTAKEHNKKVGEIRKRNNKLGDAFDNLGESANPFSTKYIPSWIDIYDAKPVFVINDVWKKFGSQYEDAWSKYKKDIRNKYAEAHGQDPASKASGILGKVSSLTKFIPGVGTAISAVTGVASKVIKGLNPNETAATTTGTDSLIAMDKKGSSIPAYITNGKGSPVYIKNVDDGSSDTGSKISGIFSAISKVSSISGIVNAISGASTAIMMGVMLAKVTQLSANIEDINNKINIGTTGILMQDTDTANVLSEVATQLSNMSSNSNNLSNDAYSEIEGAVSQ